MESIHLSAPSKGARYGELLPLLQSLLDGEPDLVANLANAVGALRVCLADASWVGVYRAVAGELVLGPFQGNVACTRIAWGRGVCGAAAAEARTIVVPDVSVFPGHIACDAGTRSEIVVPILRGGLVMGVIDVDSYQLAAFDADDAVGLGRVAGMLAELAW